LYLIEYVCAVCGVESDIYATKNDRIEDIISIIEEDHMKWSFRCDNPVKDFKIWIRTVQ